MSRLLRGLIVNPLQLFSDGDRLLRGDFELGLLLAHSRGLYPRAPPQRLLVLVVS